MEESSTVQLCVDTGVGRNEGGGTQNATVSKTKQNDKVDHEDFRGGKKTTGVVLKSKHMLLIEVTV